MDRREIKDRLRLFICGELMAEPDYPLDDGEPLITGGLIDSFALAHIGVFIEKTFGVYLRDVDLTVELMDTLEQMAGQVLAAARR